MSFLAPLFLLGALAIALPLVFHLIRRTTRQRQVFSSLMFLRPVPPRLTRRNRLEHLLLLALRCAAIGLLALGFSRPWFRHPTPDLPSPAAAKRLVVLLDISASMRRAGFWSHACDRTEAVLRQLSAADQAALVAFDLQPRVLISFDQWKATAAAARASLVRQTLSQIRPEWSGTALDTALMHAAEMLADFDQDRDGGLRQIVLVSDLQEGSQLNRLPSYEWPRQVTVALEPVGPRRSENAGLQLAGNSAERLASAGTSLRLRVGNSPQARQEQFRVGWARAEDSRITGPEISLYAPAGQTRVIALPFAATNTDWVRVILEGDAEDFDNSVFVAPPDTSPIDLLYLGSDSTTNTHQPLYYLRHVFQDEGSRPIRLRPHPTMPAPGTNQTSLAPLIIATAPLDPKQAEVLRQFLKQHATLFFVPTSAAAAATLGLLAGQGPLPAEEIATPSYRLLGEIDFNHPWFAPFSDARFSDFTKIHFWRYRRLDPNSLPQARVLARFDNGDPAIIDWPLEQGRVVILTSSWQPSDSQLALSSKFVPLLHSLLEWSGGMPDSVHSYQVGDPLPLPRSLMRAAVPIQLRRPDGSQMTLPAASTQVTDAKSPGLYTLTANAQSIRMAVNLDAAESRTEPLSPEDLEQRGVLFARRTPEPARERQHLAQLKQAELEQRQQLWRWLVAATLAILLIETWLAGRTVRRPVSPEGAPS